MTTKTLNQADATSVNEIATIAFAAILGLGLIFAAGFSQAGGMHDVAHDSRHATGFPCH
jgi:cobalt transporter subunit CbtB